MPVARLGKTRASSSDTSVAASTSGTSSARMGSMPHNAADVLHVARLGLSGLRSRTVATRVSQPGCGLHHCASSLVTSITVRSDCNRRYPRCAALSISRTAFSAMAAAPPQQHNRDRQNIFDMRLKEGTLRLGKWAYQCLQTTTDVGERVCPRGDGGSPRRRRQQRPDGRRSMDP